jgi:hypothetical protein
MTKNELCAVVDRVYASWGHQINLKDQKHIYDAWFRVLFDLSKDAVDAVVDEIVIENGFMPRPGQVRRRTVDYERADGGEVLSGGEAWQQFRRAAEAAHSGNQTGNTLHPLVAQTVKALGGVSAYNLHTNGDRDMFLDVYGRVVRAYEAERYGIPPRSYPGK